MCLFGCARVGGGRHQEGLTRDLLGTGSKEIVPTRHGPELEKPTRPGPLGFNPVRGGVLGSDLPLWLAAKMDPGQYISAIADFDPEPFPRRGTARVMQLPCSGFNLVHKSPPQLPV